MKTLLMPIVALMAFAAVAFPSDLSDVSPDVVKARGYKAKADAGDAKAQYMYAWASCLGWGAMAEDFVAEKMTNVFVYAKRAADQGYGRALWL